MSLMGSVVTLCILCWLLAATSSTSVNRNLEQSNPESQPNNTGPICTECSNGSTSLNSSETLLRNETQQPHDADLRNKSQNGLKNRTIAETSFTNQINGSTSQISFTQKQDISPAATVNDSTAGPKVTGAPLSHTNKTAPEKNITGVPSNATAALAIIPANATGTTLMTTSSAAATSVTSFTATTTSTASATSTTSATSTATSPTTSSLPTAEKTLTHAMTTIGPATTIVKLATISTSSKTTGTMPMEPEKTTTTTTTTTAAAAAAAAAATMAATAFVSTNATVQYLSPVVVVSGHDLTKQLVDKASLLAILLFGLLFFFVVVAVFVTQAYESYRRKDYTQVDYLINGMYTDSGV